MAETTLPTGTVTFLLTDIEGSTRLFHRLGPDYEGLQDAQRGIIRAAFTKREGVEVGCPGDGFLIAFGSAEDALASGVAAQRELTSFPWPDGAPVRVRMGLHSGVVRVTSTGGTYVGMALHEAARVAGVAHGGQVLVSETTRALLGSAPDDVSFADLGEHELKDLSRPLRLFEVRGAGLPSGFDPIRTVRAAVGNLGTGEAIIGRDREVMELAELVRPGALVTLVGPGGVGKTALAIAVARRLKQRDGEALPVWVVDLAALPIGAATESVASTIGTTIGIENGGDLGALGTALRDRPALLVLDNCEHVIAAVAAGAATLLEDCADLRLLATSREPLACRRERVRVVEPLGEDDAAALFVARATETGAVNVADDMEGIRRVCRRLDGLPLAVELAAKRARTLRPSAIADRLDDRFRLLTGGSRDSLPRQQTLSAAIDWSHDLLDEASRVVFRRLAVFTGGWTLDAAEQVCGADPIKPLDVLDTVGGLVDRSLVTHDASTERYSMLETIKAYAADRLAAAGEVEAMRARHLAWISAVGWDLLWSMVFGTQHPAALTIHDESDNLRAAIAHALSGGDADSGLRLAAGAAVFGMEARGDYFYDAHKWVVELAPRCEEPELLATAYSAAMNSAAGSGNFGAAMRLLEQGHALVERHDLSDGLRAQLIAFRTVSSQLTDMRAAAVAYEEALRLAMSAGHLGFGAFCHTFACGAYLAVGEVDSARIHAEQGLELARRTGSGPATARCLMWLARVHDADGEKDQAEACFVEAVAVAETSGAVAEAGGAHGGLAALCAEKGDVPGAIVHLDLAREVFESTGAWQEAASVALPRAALALRVGDADGARHHLAKTENALSRCAPGANAALWSMLERDLTSFGLDGLADELKALDTQRRARGPT